MNKKILSGLILMALVLSGCENLDDLDYLIESTPRETTHFIEGDEYDDYIPSLVLGTYARIPIRLNYSFYIGTSSTFDKNKVRKITNIIRVNDYDGYIEISDLQPNTTYYYWWATLNEVGEEIYSRRPGSFTTNNFNAVEVKTSELTPNFITATMEITDFDKLNLISSEVYFELISNGETLRVIGNRIEGTNTWFGCFIDLEKNHAYKLIGNLVIEFYNFRNRGNSNAQLTFVGEKDIKTPATFAMPNIVDLGLSVKWADCNLGASRPEQTGGYYVYPSTSVDVAGTSWDIAYNALGSGFRMPTITELQELSSYCSWSADVLNGVQGMRCTGPNGNSLFFPNKGYFSSAYVANDTHLTAIEYYYYSYGKYFSNGSYQSSFAILSGSHERNYYYNAYGSHPAYLENGEVKAHTSSFGMNIRPVYVY